MARCRLPRERDNKMKGTKMLSTKKIINEKIQETMNELLQADTFGKLENFIINENNEITYTKDIWNSWKGCNIYITIGDVSICINTVDMRVEGYYNNEYQIEKFKDFDILDRIDNIVKIHIE